MRRIQTSERSARPALGGALAALAVLGGGIATSARAQPPASKPPASMSKAALEQEVTRLQGQVDRLQSEAMRVQVAPRRTAHLVVTTAPAHLQVWGVVLAVDNDHYFVHDQKGNVFALWVDEDTKVKSKSRPVPVSAVHPGDTVLIHAVGLPGGLVARNVRILPREEVGKRHTSEKQKALERRGAPAEQKTPVFGTHAN